MEGLFGVFETIDEEAMDGDRAVRLSVSAACSLGEEQKVENSGDVGLVGRVTVETSVDTALIDSLSEDLVR